ncbi:uncharacterized protein F4817DRAFT_363598 [Daldinia loculata]|uniref:uncharacterized protein n=1 Tax=Daldinia loculata TaxID=103429 RepID=UPI0020C51681|nr:uncharacterized protein F4817DRAFT_363598 [Daldinia loculata]KAI1649263.1 hypothetical protein F4817DRAFT_363598 [Daldinia loculata]
MAIRTFLRFTVPWNRRETSWRGEDGIESSEALLEEDAKISIQAPLKQERSRTIWFLTILNVMFFGAALALYFAAWVKYTKRNACLKSTSTYSPVLEEVDMPLTDTLLNGSLWLGDSPPVWRSLPDSNETNEAWDSFEHVKPIALTRDQIIAMGKDPATVAKFNDGYWGLGGNAYVGALDFFHQVHCLSVLRHEAFRYWNRDGETVPKWNEIHWIHIQHCVGMMMEHLLCNADAEFLTYNWVEHELHPFPDMSVQKQYRDWRQLVDYRDAHGVNLTKYVEWTKPEGVRELEQPPDWWEHRGQGDKAHYANGTVIEN